MDGKIKIKLVRSPICAPEKHKRVVRGIALKTATLALDQPISLKSALKLLLEPLHLGYAVRDEVLKINNEILSIYKDFGFEDVHMSDENIDKAIEYIRKTPIIRDVLISGGDGLTLALKR